MDNPCCINFLQRTVVSSVNVPIRTLSISVEIVSNPCTFDYNLAVNSGFRVNYEKGGGGVGTMPKKYCTIPKNCRTVIYYETTTEAVL